MIFYSRGLYSSMLYASYNNHDVSIVSQIILSLKAHSTQIWFDRHEIPLFTNRGRTLMDAGMSATFALVFISNKYSSSSYCLEELAYLEQYCSGMIAVIIDDIELANINQSGKFVDLVNTQSLNIEATVRAIRQLLSVHTEMNYKATISSERVFYILNLINNMEVKLSQTITGMALIDGLDSMNTDKNSLHIRPQVYVPDQIKSGSFSLTIDDENLALENLVSLLKIQPYTILQGASGSGKSVIGWLVALHSAHEYRLSDDMPLPVYLDCRTWKQNQSFSQFFSDNWQIAHDSRVWLSEHPAFFIIDIDEFIIQEHPDYLEQIESYCLSSGTHSCLLITADDTESANSKIPVAIVSVEPLTNRLIEDFAETFLPEVKAKAFREWYTTIEPGRLERQVDYVSFVIEYLQIEADTEVSYPIRHLATRITHQRWKNLIDNLDIPISYAEFHASLTYLAWSILSSKTPYYVNYSEALNYIGDSTIIELGIELDILEINHDYLRFKSRLIQEHLSAYLLLDDGIFKHLKKPDFDEDGNLLDSKWDRVFLALFEIIEPDQYDEIIELIDDVNPFLAVEFARRDRELLKQFLPQLINKLLDIRRKNPLAHTALGRILIELPHVELIGKHLGRLMNTLNLQMMDVLFGYLKNLALRIPDQVIEDVHNLERNFHDSRQELLSQYSLEHWSMYSYQLVHHPDPTVQRNAISLLGESKYTGVLPALCSCLNSPSDSVFRDTMSAVMRVIKDNDSFEYFFHKLPARRFDLDMISTIFAQLGRPLSEYLVGTLSVAMVDFNREFCPGLIQVQESIVGVIITRQMNIDGYLPDDNSNELKSDNAMKLIDLIQRRFRNIDDKTLLEQQFSDMTRILKSMGRSSNPDDNKKESLNRARDTLNNQDVTSSQTVASVQEQSIPSGLLAKLSDKDWLIRYRTLQELMIYPDKEISQHLIYVANNDDDVQVRITALDILSHITQTDEIRDVLIKALEDEDSLVIDQITDYITGIEDFDVSNIIHLLKHPSPQTIVAAIEILTRHQHSDAVDALGMLLDDDRIPWLAEETIAHCAAKGLRAIGTPLALKYLKQSNIILVDDQVQIIEPGIEYKQEKKYTLEQKLRLTLIAIRNDEWDLSQKAARYLRKLAKSLRGTQNQVIISELEDALDDELWTVRWAVVEALAWIKSPASIPKVTLLLQDSNWMVQVAAIRALVELEARETAVDVAVLLADTNTAVAEATAEALGILNNEEAIDSLERALELQDEFVRLAAIKSISQILQEEASPYLVSMLDDSYNHIRWFAIKQLSTISREEHLAAIVRLLPDQSRPAWEKGTISDHAIVALRNINTEESQSIIDGWISKSKKT